MRARTSTLVTVVAIAIVIFGIARCGRTQNTPEATNSTPPETLPVVPGPEGIRRLIDSGHLDQAQERAREWLHETEQFHGSESEAAMRAFDLLVETLALGSASDEDSIALGRRAVALRESRAEPEPIEIAKSMTHLGILLENAARFDEAAELFGRALDIRREALPADHPDLADALGNLAITLMTQGDYAAARPLFEQALAIREEVPDSEVELAQLLNGFGVLLYWTHDYEASREIHARALAIRREELEAEHPSIAGSLQNLGAALEKMDQLGPAIDCYEEALRIRERRIPGHPRLASPINNLAEIYTRLGQIERANEYYRRALEIFETGLPPNHPKIAKGLDGLADGLRHSGQHLEAQALSKRALRIQHTALGPQHPDVAASLVGLSESQYALGEVGAAIQSALEAETIGRSHAQLTARTLSEREALGYASSRAAGLNLALSLCRRNPDPHHVGRTWDAVVRSRGLVLDEMVGRVKAVNRTEDPDLVLPVVELREARQSMAELFVRGPAPDAPEAYRSEVEQAEQRKERAERALAEKSLVFRQTLTLRQSGLTDVLDRLPPSTALVAYVVYDDIEPAGDKSSARKRYLALVASPGHDDIWLVPIGEARDIDASVAQWREAVAPPEASGKAAEAAYRDVGWDLRRRIWDPISARLGNARAVLVVLDGSLQLVNLATLPATNGRFLAETGPLLHYLSAERDVISATTPGQVGRGLLALGDPAFDDAEPLRVSSASPGGRRSGPGCGDFRAARFSSLDGMAREIDEVIALWKELEDSDVLKLTRGEASESAFKRHAPGHRVLHLATHGFFLGGPCESSAAGRRSITGLAHADPNSVDSDDLSNPLLLSGLAMAGANRRNDAGPMEQDGILTAEEIASEDLSGTEWVVLSACDTGVGEVQAGEGVFGLRRAFQVAGARTLIMSLWSVDDIAAAEWMGRLYRSRMQGVSTSSAVNRANRSMLEQRRRDGESTHPFYWGAFVAVGDWH